jgi:hypothetical protein
MFTVGELTLITLLVLRVLADMLMFGVFVVLYVVMKDR